MGERQNSTVSEHELGEIRALIEQNSGIVFDQSRERFFATRVLEHIVEKKMPHGSELLRSIRSSTVEYDSLLERLLTQETSFFRYPDVFDALEKRVVPELQSRKFWNTPRSLRIWSAGCATGEEPYSIAMTLAGALEFPEAWNISILATDVSRRALQHAERGSYPARDLECLTALQRQEHFTRAGEQLVVKPRIRNMVTFAPINLAQAVYPGRFDCIFCMNVLIYFGSAQRTALIRRFYDYLEPGGYLFLGHAETVNGTEVPFVSIIHRDARIYRRPETTMAQESHPGVETSAGGSTA